MVQFPEAPYGSFMKLACDLEGIWWAGDMCMCFAGIVHLMNRVVRPCKLAIHSLYIDIGPVQQWYSFPKSRTEAYSGCTKLACDPDGVWWAGDLYGSFAGIVHVMYRVVRPCKLAVH